MSNKLSPLSGPVDASGEPDCPECGYFVGHKDFCTVGHQRASATPPSNTLMVRNAAEFAVRAVADTLLAVLLELPNRYGDNHTIDRRIAIAAAQKMKADAIRAVDAAILNTTAAAVPSSPAQAASTRTLAALDELAAKPELRFKGWDTYGSEPLDDRAITAVRTFLGYPWAVVPCADGGIQLEMHHSCMDMEIEFNADGSIEAAYAETVADRLAALPPSSPVADPSGILASQRATFDSENAAAEARIAASSPAQKEKS